MSAAVSLEKMDQTPFLASNVDLADVSSPMQEDEDSPIVWKSREQELAAIPVPTPEELAQAVSHLNYRLSKVFKGDVPVSRDTKSRRG